MFTKLGLRSIPMWIFEALPSRSTSQTLLLGLAAGVPKGGVLRNTLTILWLKIPSVEYGLMGKKTCFKKYPLKMVIFHSYVSLPE